MKELTPRNTIRTFLTTEARSKTYIGSWYATRIGQRPTEYETDNMDNRSSFFGEASSAGYEFTGSSTNRFACA
jgi:hypothetical protein